MLRKLIFGSLSFFILLFAGLIAFTYLYQDKIVGQFIEQVNKHLRTPVKVNKITFSAINKFPRIAVSLDHIIMYEGIEGSKQALATAERLYCTFSLLDLLQGNFVVQEVFLENGNVNLSIDANKQNNYTIFYPVENGTSTETEKFRFNINKIHLNQVLVDYKDVAARQHFTVLADDMAASLFIEGQTYLTVLKGKLESRQIGLDQDYYFQNRKLSVNATFTYDDANRLFHLEPSVVRTNQSEFLVEGDVNTYNTTDVDLTLKGTHADIQTLLSLLPESISEQFSTYMSEGDIYFEGTVQGKMTSQTQPAIQVKFGCRNASFFHPDYKKKVTNVNLRGNYTNGDRHNLETSVLTLHNIEAVLDGKPITGNFLLSNFNDYYLKVQAKGEVDVNSALAFYPLSSIKEARGLIDADFQIEGRVHDLKNMSNRSHAIRSSGDITVKGLDFLLQKAELPFYGFNGNFMFRDQDLAINNFSGHIGNSHFLLNGLFKNLIAFLLMEDQPISIEADLQSDQIDMDELLSGNLSGKMNPATHQVSQAQWNTASEKQEYTFSIYPKLVMAFACEVDKIKFRKFRGENLKGKLNVNHQIAKISNTSINTLQGKADVNSTIDARQKNAITVSANTHFTGLDIAELFYVFEDFNQDFLTAKHIKGKVYADVKWDMDFDKSLALDQKKLAVDVWATIRNGELNNFEPLQRLSRFVKEEQLTHARFDELNNYIRIANCTVYIPPMAVYSNVSNITLQGTHTFDHHINYRFQVPMKSLSLKTKAGRERKAERERAFGMVESGTPNYLYLVAKGTTDDYKIAYDMQTVKTEMKARWVEEKHELKQAFKNKGVPAEKKIELAAEEDEEEYFDFSKPVNNQK